MNKLSSKYKTKKLSLPSRIIVALASLALIATFFLPVWFIFLIAPQYPEGLTMQIWLTKITGQVEIINGLNHYIGMKHISEDMFPEFDFLIYIVGFFILYGLAVAVTGSRKLLFSYLIITVLGGIAAMVDFYRWGYDYGHNLDPKAAIQVPGLSYQPPLLGHKTLLNFDAYSYPDLGGWVVIGAAAIFFGVWFFEYFRNRKKERSHVKRRHLATAAGIAALFLVSCNSEPQPFQIGKDICEECNMTIMDPKFGAQIVTKKGKIYKFDDAHCMKYFMKAGTVKETDIKKTVISDYQDPKNFIDLNSTFFVVSPELKSPMNSNAAGFSNKEAAEQKAKETNGNVRTWKELVETI